MPNNLKNTEATQFRSGSKAVENGKKGGKRSGEVRKQKSDLRKMMNMWLDEEHTNKNGGTVTGNQAIMNQIISNAMNPDSKNWSKSIDIILQMSGALISDEQKARQQAETDLIRAKVEMMSSTDTTALDKLDSILTEMRNAAKSEKKGD